MECTRFLFPLTDAVKTVLNSLLHAQGGEVFIPNINSFKMENVIEAVKQIMNLDKVNMKVVGMRPGEKFHEDMLAKTELDFTHQVNDKLLTVLPQYTKKNHTYNNLYKGLEFNSSLHNNDSISDLVKIIKKGIEDAN
jgi:FlaA1/EpsC-like NDP-sugar epimerase